MDHRRKKHLLTLWPRGVQRSRQEKMGSGVEDYQINNRGKLSRGEDQKSPDWKLS